MSAHMFLQVALEGGLVRAKGAGKGPLPRVGQKVPLIVLLLIAPPKDLRAVLAHYLSFRLQNTIHTMSHT